MTPFQYNRKTWRVPDTVFLYLTSCLWRSNIFSECEARAKYKSAINNESNAKTPYPARAMFFFYPTYSSWKKVIVFRTFAPYNSQREQTKKDIGLTILNFAVCDVMLYSLYGKCILIWFNVGGVKKNLMPVYNPHFYWWNATQFQHVGDWCLATELYTSLRWHAILLYNMTTP